MHFNSVSTRVEVLVCSTCLANNAESSGSDSYSDYKETALVELWFTRPPLWNSYLNIHQGCSNSLVSVSNVSNVIVTTLYFLYGA